MTKESMEATKGTIKIYISGGMTGFTEEEYKERFRDFELLVRNHLIREGYDKVIVFNPANKSTNVVDGMEYEDCLDIDFAFIKVSDAIAMMDGWNRSKGAKRELHMAMAYEKTVYAYSINKGLVKHPGLRWE